MSATILTGYEPNPELEPSSAIPQNFKGYKHDPHISSKDKIPPYNPSHATPTVESVMNILHKHNLQDMAESESWGAIPAIELDNILKTHTASAATGTPPTPGPATRFQNKHTTPLFTPKPPTSAASTASTPTTTTTSLDLTEIHSSLLNATTNSATLATVLSQSFSQSQTPQPGCFKKLIQKHTTAAVIWINKRTFSIESDARCTFRFELDELLREAVKGHTYVPHTRNHPR